MPDLSALVSSIVVLLSPYLTVGGLKLAEKAGQAAQDPAQRIWALLAPSAKNDAKLWLMIESFSADSTDADVRALLKKKLSKHLDTNPELANSLIDAVGGSQRIQEIVAKGGSTIESIKQKNRASSGRQTVLATGSRIKDVKQEM